MSCKAYCKAGNAAKESPHEASAPPLLNYNSSDVLIKVYAAHMIFLTSTDCRNTLVI